MVDTLLAKAEQPDKAKAKIYIREEAIASCDNLEDVEKAAKSIKMNYPKVAAIIGPKCEAGVERLAANTITDAANVTLNLTIIAPDSTSIFPTTTNYPYLVRMQSPDLSLIHI